VNAFEAIKVLKEVLPIGDIYPEEKTIDMYDAEGYGLNTLTAKDLRNVAGAALVLAMQLEGAAK
jgi:hypothetical protein